MSKLSDHYPILTGCDLHSQSGECGIECPEFVAGNCHIEEEIRKEFALELIQEEVAYLKDLVAKKKVDGNGV